MQTIQHKQTGMTFLGMLIVIAALICIAIVGMKVFPAYVEFMNVKSALKKIVTSEEDINQKTVADAFSKYARVDNISVVSGKDLVVNGDNISVSYQVTVPLVANASILLDFNATATK